MHGNLKSPPYKYTNYPCTLEPLGPLHPQIHDSVDFMAHRYNILVFKSQKPHMSCVYFKKTD